MTRAIVLCTALAALFTAPASADDAAPPCQQLRIAGLDMATEPDGLIAVQADIDNHPIMLAVDTGAIHTVISSRVADALKLPRDLSADVYEMVGGTPIYQIAYSHSFALGTLAAGRTGLLVAPSLALPPDTDGLLGPDAMKNYDVEIDYAHGRFALFSQDHCPGQVVYWTHDAYARVPMHVDKEWHISVPIELDGKPFNALFDTGSERSLMTMRTARELFGIDEDNPALTKEGDVSVNGAAPVTVYHYPFAALNIEGIAVQHPDIEIMASAAGDRQQFIVGASVLRQLHLYVAYKEQALYATPAEAK